MSAFSLLCLHINLNNLSTCNVKEHSMSCFLAKEFSIKLTILSRNEALVLEELSFFNSSSVG